MARSWVLNGETLPYQEGYKEDIVETSVMHKTITGRSVKQFTSRKSRYTLTYNFLTQAQLTALKDIENTNSVVDFSVVDGSLTISTTSVHVILGTRDYPYKGSEFRTSISL